MQKNVWREQVLAQLERILQSGQFVKSERLRRFLAYVVEQTLDSNLTILRSYNIAVEVFGKGSEFDPGDPYVRNISRLTRKALASYYAAAGTGDDIRIDVPAGNYIATFERVHKYPIAMATHLDRRSGQQMPCAANDLINESPTGVASARIATLCPAVAVIPLRYQGDHADSEVVVGDILASSVIAGLSKSSHLNVISWLSTTRFRDSVWDVAALSKSLNCDYVLSGSYRCKMGVVSLFVEIADSKTREVIWAEMLETTVERLLSASADVIVEIISHVARVVLNQEIRKATSDPIESLALHTKLIAGIHHMHSVSDTRFNKVKSQFDEILHKYPRHSTVNALQAQWYVLKINRSSGWKSVGSEDNKARARAHLQSALEENLCHPLALTMSGLVETQFNQNPERGLEFYDSAEHYNPNEPVLMAYKAALLSYKGEGDAAIRYAEKALALSPFDPQLSLFHTCAAASYYSAGDCANAERHADKAFEINPVHTSNLRTLVAIQFDLGKLSEARTSARRLMTIDPGFTTGSYLRKSPNAGFKAGRKIADRLRRAGVPSGA